jgi:hypothetical protein
LIRDPAFPRCLSQSFLYSFSSHPPLTFLLVILLSSFLYSFILPFTFLFILRSSFFILFSLILPFIFLACYPPLLLSSFFFLLFSLSFFLLVILLSSFLYSPCPRLHKDSGYYFSASDREDSGFDSRSVHMGFVGKVAHGLVFFSA